MIPRPFSENNIFIICRPMNRCALPPKRQKTDYLATYPSMAGVIWRYRVMYRTVMLCIFKSRRSSNPAQRFAAISLARQCDKRCMRR